MQRCTQPSRCLSSAPWHFQLPSKQVSEHFTLKSSTLLLLGKTSINSSSKLNSLKSLKSIGVGGLMLISLGVLASYLSSLLYLKVSISSLNFKLSFFPFRCLRFLQSLQPLHLLFLSCISSHISLRSSFPFCCSSIVNHVLTPLVAS